MNALKLCLTAGLLAAATTATAQFANTGATPAATPRAA